MATKKKTRKSTRILTSAQQTKLASLIRAGKRQVEVARQLGLSEATVSREVGRLGLAKSNLTEKIRVELERGTDTEEIKSRLGITGQQLSNARYRMKPRA